MKYRIEIKFFSGWGDAGWTDETGFDSQPTRFGTAAEAQAALEQFLADVMCAARAGHVKRPVGRADYRIARTMN